MGNGLLYRPRLCEIGNGTDEWRDSRVRVVLQRQQNIVSMGEYKYRENGKPGLVDLPLRHLSPGER